MFSGSSRFIWSILINVFRGLIVWACFFPQSSSFAQTEDNVQYVLPDVPPALAEALRYENEKFSLAFLFGTLLDYTIFHIDERRADTSFV